MPGAFMVAYDVLAPAGYGDEPSYACIQEFEDVLVETLNARRFPEGNVLPSKRRGLHRNGSSGRKQPKHVLIVVAMNLLDLSRKTAYLPSDLSHWDRVVLYLFDAYDPEFGRSPSSYQRLKSLLKKDFRYDHLFLPLSATEHHFEGFDSPPKTLLPLACDVLKFGRNQEQRAIAVNAYGRQPPALTRLLSRKYNHRASDTAFLHTGHTSIKSLIDREAHRSQFWQLLGQSWLTVAYDTPAAPRSNRSFEHSFLSQRWFEGISVGCCIVGKRPTCPETDAVLHWEDSTIELPDSPEEAVEVIAKLLEDKSRLREIGNRNYYYALKENDWRHRIREMLAILDLPEPAKLTSQIDELDGRAKLVASPILGS